MDLSFLYSIFPIFLNTRPSDIALFIVLLQHLFAFAIALIPSYSECTLPSSLYSTTGFDAFPFNLALNSAFASLSFANFLNSCFRSSSHLSPLFWSPSLSLLSSSLSLPFFLLLAPSSISLYSGLISLWYFISLSINPTCAALKFSFFTSPG